MSGLLEFVSSNLKESLPIIAVGVFGFAIFVERLRALFIVYPIRNQLKFLSRVQDLVMRGEISGAVALCDYYKNKPAATIVKTALLRADQPDTLIESGLELELEEATRKIEARTGFLSMIANVATLLGLLGTIAGLIKSFAGIAAADAQQKTALLAAGISEAMNHTMMGLSVAIPSMIAFSFLMNKTNKLNSSVESAAIKVIDIFRQRYFEAEKGSGEVA